MPRRIQQLIDACPKEAYVYVGVKSEQYKEVPVHVLGKGNSITRVKGFDYAMVGDVQKILG